MLFSQNVRSLFSTYRYPLSFVFAVGLFAYSQQMDTAVSEDWPPPCEVQAQELLQKCLDRASKITDPVALDAALEACACSYDDARLLLCGPGTVPDPECNPTPTPTPTPTLPPLTPIPSTPPPTYPPASPGPSNCPSGTCNLPGY